MRDINDLLCPVLTETLNRMKNEWEKENEAWALTHKLSPDEDEIEIFELVHLTKPELTEEEVSEMAGDYE